MSKGNGMLRTILIVIAILVTLALAGVSAIMNYGNQAHQVTDNSEDIAAVCADLATEKPKIMANTVNNAAVNRDIYYMQQDIEEIKEDNQVIKAGIDTIIEKMNDEP